MRISAVEEYGLRCLVALARKGPDSQLSISEIAELEGLSVPYASKLLAILRRAGLVRPNGVEAAGSVLPLRLTRSTSIRY
jgi:Rrf2 family iron-sulfur cluster assembly transcriptional regulator